MHKVLSKPDYDTSMMFTFQVKYNDTKIDTSPMHLNSRSQFGIVIPNDNANDNVAKFTLCWNYQSWGNPETG